MASINSSKFGIPTTNFECKQFLLNIFTVIGAVIIITLEINTLMRSISGKELEDFFYGATVTGSILIFQGLLFFLFGVLTIHTLNINFNKFYRKNVCDLIIVTFALSVPILFRGSLNLLRGVS